MMTERIPTELAIYSGDSGEVQVQLRSETLWLTQRQMGEVFGTTPENILMHLKNIFQEQELDEPSTTEDFLVVR